MNRAYGIPWDDLARDERQPVPELWTAIDPEKVKELALAGCAVGEVEDFRGSPEADAVPYPSVMPEVRSRYVDERQDAVADQAISGRKKSSIPNEVGARQTHRGRDDAGAGRWDVCLGLRFPELLMDEFEGVVRHFGSHSSSDVPMLANKGFGSLLADLSPNLHLLLLN
ncbi:hypothetical protein PsorP6_016842 [Peronosclerospora sorghi]|uniref:Uncharacterized protein n=1 Tax=Peronosclerospora sorghi TaxID=230839 RepID=A0ACC0WCL7_9STRA|nr:hypothetical protein PsorP6_016842 [Peronosclerospora sorghi]